MAKDKSQLREAVRAAREQIYQQVRERLADESRTYNDIAKSVGVSVASVQRLAREGGISRKVGPRAKPELPSNTAQQREVKIA